MGQSELLPVRQFFNFFVGKYDRAVRCHHKFFSKSQR
jgi:hypothetical protein